MDLDKALDWGWAVYWSGNARELVEDVLFHAHARVLKRRRV